MRSILMNIGLMFALFGTFVLAKTAQKRSMFPEVLVSMVTAPAKKKAATQKAAQLAISKNTNFPEDLDFKIPSSPIKSGSPQDFVFGKDLDMSSFVVTDAPSESPSAMPTVVPSAPPTVAPSFTFAPSAGPSLVPSMTPSASPSFVPSTVPSAGPSFVPSTTPSAGPSFIPSTVPSAAPSAEPTVTPSVAPTVVPSPKPSASPSFTPVPTTYAPSPKGAQIATIALSQTVSGMTSAQWNANAAANCAIFALTVEAVTEGAVLASQVSSCTVTDARRTRRVLINVMSNGINVGYVVTVPASTDITTVTTSITNTITTAVTDNTFTTKMNQVAQNESTALNYTSPLTSAASTTVTVQSVSVIGASNNKNNNLSSGQIAGIVIGVLVGSFLLGMGCYAFIIYGRAYWSINAAEDRREFAVNIGLSDEENMYASSEGLTILPPLSPTPLIEDVYAPAPDFSQGENTQQEVVTTTHGDDEVFYSEPHNEHEHANWELEEVVVVREDKTTQL